MARRSAPAPLRRTGARIGLYDEVAVRAAADAFYQRLLDEYWVDFKEIFERPEVRRAHAVIRRAIAEAFVPVEGDKRGARARRENGR